jgi:hypothetical protein
MPCCFSSLASVLACSHEVRFMAERVSSIPMDDKSDLTHQTGLRHKEGGKCSRQLDTDKITQQHELNHTT